MIWSLVSRILGNNEKTDMIRGAGIKAFNFLINLATGLNITDCSSGFKAFKMSGLRKLNLLEDQFQSSEVIIESAKKGLKISEVPITCASRVHGETKKGSNLVYGFNFFKVILKTWWR